MPQPPPQSQSSHNGRHAVRKFEGEVGKIYSGELKSSIDHASIYCLLALLIFNTFFLLLVFDSVTLLSVNAAILQDQKPYKTYLTRAKYEHENDKSEDNFGKDKWAKTEVRFLTRVKSSENTPAFSTYKAYHDDSDEDRISSGISASDFHIIELEAENKNEGDPAETLRIHLVRKSSVVHPQLRVVVQNEDEKQVWSPSSNGTGGGEPVNCHFVGHVTGVPSSAMHRPTTSDDDDEKSDKTSGLAIFSACPPSNGFSGLIIMEDGRQWYMEPSEKTRHQHHSRQRRNAYSSEHESLEHVLLPHSQLAGHLAARISDVLRVPLPQLEEAARLAAADAQARRNVRRVDDGPTSRRWDDDYDALESLQGESSILTPFFYNGAILPFFGRTGDRKETHVRKVASTSKKTGGNGEKSSVQTTLLTPLENGGSRSSTSTIRTTTSTSSTTSSRTTTRKTASSSISSASVENLSGQARPLPRVVEIAVFTDEELYNKMKSKFNQDTTAQLKEYATAMVNMMDVMYQHSSLGVDLRFKLVYLEVMKKRPSPLKTHGGKAKAYLSSFCDYAGEKNVNSAQWDHALLLTGLDLHEEGVKTTAGLAWAGTMCFRYYSCSISEGLNFASAYITTHEIGHSLGMEHDGVGISESCDANKYIMSPTTGPGKVTWSTCSASNLQDFIKYGTSELRGKTGKGNFMISRPICLEELVSNRGKKSFEFSETKSSSSSLIAEGILDVESDLKLPGEKYDANYQCSLGMGSFFKPHFERHKPPFDNICWILYCGNGTHAISTHPALEGTPCDRKKYCRAGQCVKRPDASG